MAWRVAGDYGYRPGSGPGDRATTEDRVNQERPLPLVSMCIPTFNRRERVLAAARACLAQTWPNLRVFVCDNASDDGTLEALRPLEAASGGRLILVRNPRNMGMMANFQRCLDVAEGTYIKIVCSDDEPHPEMVEKQVRALEDHPNVVACAAWRRRTGTGLAFRAYEPLTRMRGGHWDGRQVVRRVYRVANTVGGPVQLLTRLDALRDVGFRSDPEIGAFFDIDPVLRLLANGLDLWVIPEVLCEYNTDLESATVKTLLSPDVQAAFFTYRQVMAADAQLSRCLVQPRDGVSSRRTSVLLVTAAGLWASRGRASELKPLADMMARKNPSASTRALRSLVTLLARPHGP